MKDVEKEALREALKFFGWGLLAIAGFAVMVVVLEVAMFTAAIASLIRAIVGV